MAYFLDASDTRRAERWLIGMIGLVAAFTAWRHHMHHMEAMLRFNTDSWGYYQFLPALIGTHEFTHLPWAHVLEDGRRLDLFTIGVAMLQAPFFFLGHSIAWISGASMDGYSLPYAITNIAATITYLCFGCRLLYQVIRRLFSSRTAFFTVLVLYAGTNLFYYSSYEQGMSHVYSYFLFAWLLHLTERSIEALTPGRVFSFFVCGAMLVLVRPLNGIVLLLPLLYKVDGFQEIADRLRWLTRYPGATLIGVLVAVVLFLPQLMYWHAVTDQWLVFTYGVKNEGFEFGKAMFGAVLFSQQNGWFIYTPLMLPVMAALLMLAWKKKDGARTILLLWTLAWWLYASWWCWWLGGAFGHRGFVEYLAFLSLPLAWIIDRARQVEWRQRALRIFLILAVFYNIRMSTLYEWPWEGPDWTWAKLFEVYGRFFS